MRIISKKITMREAELELIGKFKAPYDNSLHNIIHSHYFSDIRREERDQKLSHSSQEEKDLNNNDGNEPKNRLSNDEVPDNWYDIETDEFEDRLTSVETPNLSAD